MKRKFLIFLVVCFSIIFAVECFSSIEMHSNNKDNMFEVYLIDINTFREFLNNPSMDILKNDNKDMYVFEKSNRKNYVKRTTVSDISYIVDEYESGIMRIGDLPVYSEFIDFIGNLENIEQLLKDNNVDCIVKDYVLIECTKTYNIPVTIWIQTNRENYFVTIDEEVDYCNPLSMDFKYNLYTNNEYINKFQLKDGTVIINDKDVSDKIFVKFENKEVYLPFRSVVESLGGYVEWNSKEKIAFFSKDNKRYALRLNQYPYIVEIKDLFSEFPIAPGGTFENCYIDENGTLLINRMLAEKTVEYLSVKMEIDYANNIVYFYNKTWDDSLS